MGGCDERDLFLISHGNSWVESSVVHTNHSCTKEVILFYFECLKQLCVVRYLEMGSRSETLQSLHVRSLNFLKLSLLGLMVMPN